MIFVDTGAWFASVVPLDKQHQKAIAWLKNNQESLFYKYYFQLKFIHNTLLPIEISRFSRLLLLVP